MRPKCGGGGGVIMIWSKNNEMGAGLSENAKKQLLPDRSEIIVDVAQCKDLLQNRAKKSTTDTTN